MSKATKRLDGMRKNPRDDWRIEDVESVCDNEGLNCSPPTRGGHYKVSHPSRPEILTIPAARPIKPVYIRRLLAFIDRVQESGE